MRPIAWIVGAACLAGAGGRPDTAGAAELHAGVAVVDITPPLGYRMSGYFSERLATGVHDRLHAKAIVLRQGDTQAAMVFCDIIGIGLEVSQRARRTAEQKTGIPQSNIVIAATHSHTGPLYMGMLRKHFHDKAVAETGKDAAETVDYPALLVERIVQAIAEAQASARPVKLAAGIGRQQGLSFNRRFHMKDGAVRFNPGKTNPAIVRPAGPIDPGVHVLLLRDAATDKPLASLTVFPLHLDTVGGTEYSADYPHYLERSLRAELGETFVSAFGNGTCGDINHIDVSNRNRQGGQGEAKRIGETLAETVKATLPALKPAPPSLAVRCQTVEIPLQQYGDEEIAWARRMIQQVDSGSVPFLDRVKAYKILSLRSRGTKTIRIDVQVFRLSDDVALVTLPGEVFVDLGLAIKRASPFANTAVVELAQDAPGYIPTKKAFAEGSYETVNSRVQPGGGERLVETAVGLLRELKAARP